MLTLPGLVCSMTPDWLRSPCHLAPLLLLVRHLPSPALILVGLQFSQAGLEPPDPSDCAGQQLPDRIACGKYGIDSVECLQLGCCFDKNFNMCFFPVSCEQFATLAGGYSALLLLPGKDRPGQGSVSMLEGGNWCSRDPHDTKGSLQIEMEIPEVRLVYLTTTFTMTESFTHPFTFYFSVEHYKLWKLLRETDMLNMTGQSERLHDFTQKMVSTFYANRLKVRPKPDKGHPCVKVEVVTCPGVPPTEEPENITEVPPTTEAPVIEPEMVEGVDERPTAIAVGSFVVIMLSVLLALIILIDIPTFAKNFVYMRKSINSFIRYNKKKRALANGSVCRDKLEDGKVKRSDDPRDNISTVSDELLLNSTAGFDITREMEAQHALVHPEIPDDMGIGDWMTESDDASLVQYETVF